MRTLPLLSVAILAGSIRGVCAQNLKANLSPTFETLKAESYKDPATLGSMENAKGAAGTTFTGEASPLIDIQVLSPAEFVDVPGTPRTGPTPTTPAPDPGKPVPAKDDGNPSYHFEGTTPLPGLTIYHAVKDTAGGNNETHGGKAPATLGTYIKRGLLGLGFLGLIAGIFCPPLLIVGAALAGAGAGMMLSDWLKK